MTTRESLLRGGPCYGYGEGQHKHMDGCPGFSMGKATRSRMCAKESRIRKITCSGYGDGAHAEGCPKITKGASSLSSQCRKQYLRLLEHCSGYARGLHVLACNGKSLTSSQASSACISARSKIWHYGLQPEQFLELLNSQDGLCALCETDQPGSKGWVVDHDHNCCSGVRSCGRCIRAILCSNCNTALGLAGDDPQRLRRMATYAEGHAGTQ